MMSFDASHVAMSSSSSNVGNKIHVLLIEHESIDHDNIMNMLRCFNYEVTSVRYAASGISVLLKEKKVHEFDLVIANISTTHEYHQYSFGHQLLQLALKMNILVVLTSSKEEEDAVGTMKAVEQLGVLMCVKKPLTMEVLAYLWQHVSREKKHHSQLLHLKQINKYNPAPQPPQTPHPDLYTTSRRKVLTEWTDDLHYRFMKAARYLGPGRCYPKDILELMNVPGLTRMQVASHLQKCRNAKWLPPNQRRIMKLHTNYNHEEVSRPATGKRGPRARPACYGSMPVPALPPPPPQQLAAAPEDPYANYYQQQINGQAAGAGMDAAFGAPFPADPINFSQPQLGYNGNLLVPTHDQLENVGGNLQYWDYGGGQLYDHWETGTGGGWFDPFL